MFGFWLRVQIGAGMPETQWVRRAFTVCTYLAYTSPSFAKFPQFWKSPLIYATLVPLSIKMVYPPSPGLCLTLEISQMTALCCRNLPQGTKIHWVNLHNNSYMKQILISSSSLDPQSCPHLVLPAIWLFSLSLKWVSFCKFLMIFFLTCFYDSQLVYGKVFRTGGNPKYQHQNLLGMCTWHSDVAHSCLLALCPRQLPVLWI